MTIAAREQMNNRACRAFASPLNENSWMKRNAWLSASLPFITGANRALVSGHSVVGFRFLLIFILLLTNLDSVCRADRVEPQMNLPQHLRTCSR